VVKSTEAVETIRERIEAQAKRIYPVVKIVERYMACIEEIINIPLLMERLDDVVKRSALAPVIAEIVLQSRVEFNYPEELDVGDAIAE
jgi:hypothetical protein